MGLFRRNLFKVNKSYDISEALNILELLKGKGIENSYTLEPDETENGKYKFIDIEVSKQKEESIRKNKETKKAFYERINAGREYRNISIKGDSSNIKFKNSESLA